MRRGPRWAAALLLSALAWPTSALRAQELLRPGREVRVYVTGVAGIFEGELLAASANALTLRQRDGSIFTLQAAQVQRSEVLGSRRSTKGGAMLGAGVGIAVGVWWAVASRNDCLQAGGFCEDEGANFREWKLVAPALAGALVGGAVGHLVRSPAWVPGFLPAPAADGTAMGLSWRVPVGVRATKPRGA